MTKRLNITLPDDVVAHADEFARRERYSRSGLIRAALEAFVTRGGETRADGAEVARETTGTYAPVVPPPATSLERVEPLLCAFFAARDDVDAAWLFGSVRRGEAGPLSDVDVAVLFSPEIERGERFDRRMRIAGALESVLRVPRVDVVSMRDASVVLAHRIATQGIRVGQDGTTHAAEAELRAISAYIEYLPVLAEAHRHFDERMKPYARPR